jgi:hypothetical protein
MDPDTAYGMVEIVDEVWHQHLLSTRDYASMCRAALCEMIHHEQRGLDTNGRDDTVDASSRTIEALTRTFRGPISSLWLAAVGSHAVAKCCAGHVEGLPN